MNSAELKKYLAEHTNMTERDIDKHINDGITVYSNDDAGYSEFKENCINALCDEDDVPDMWNELDVVGDYRMDFVL